MVSLQAHKTAPGQTHAFTALVFFSDTKLLSALQKTKQNPVTWSPVEHLNICTQQVSFRCFKKRQMCVNVSFHKLFIHFNKYIYSGPVLNGIFEVLSSSVLSFAVTIDTHCNHIYCQSITLCTPCISNIRYLGLIFVNMTFTTENIGNQLSDFSQDRVCRKERKNECLRP